MTTGWVRTGQVAATSDCDAHGRADRTDGMFRPTPPTRGRPTADAAPDRVAA